MKSKSGRVAFTALLAALALALSRRLARYLK